MTTPLFLLRCVQLGISIRDLDLLTIGMVNDMFVENRNDEYKGWRQVATQEDSRHPIRFINVVFPEPDGPIIAR